MKKASIVFILLTAFLMCRCTDQKERIEEHYLKVNYSSLTFTASDNVPITVAIDAFPNVWEAQSNDVAWLKITNTTDNAITIMAEDYDGEADREGSIDVSAGEGILRTIKVRQLGKGAILPMKYRLIEESFSAAISPSGEYVGGFYTLYDAQDHKSYCPFIINVKTDERITLGPYPMSLYHLMDAMAMNDQGILYIDEGNRGGVACFTIDGEDYQAGKAEGFDRPTVISGTSLGGRVMIGWAAGSPEGHTYGPVKVVDGEYFALPLPEKNFRNEKFTSGILGRGVSANGEIMYGATWENDDSGMVYWDKEGNVHYVGEDVRAEREVVMNDGQGETYKYTLVDGIIDGGSAGCASPNGKWLAGIFRTEALNAREDDIVSAYWPAFFNTETQETIVMEDYSGYGGCAVTDDGLGFTTGVGGFGSSGPVFDIVNKTVVYDSFPAYIQDKFGIKLPSGARLDYLCADGSAILGNIMKASAQGPDVYYWYASANVENAEQE